MTVKYLWLTKQYKKIVGKIFQRVHIRKVRFFSLNAFITVDGSHIVRKKTNVYNVYAQFIQLGNHMLPVNYNRLMYARPVIRS